MKIIVGLGNPGDKYKHTRHNIGFLLLDQFAQKHDFSDWKYESKFTGDIASGHIQGERVMLLKPQTYMNLSGESVQKILSFYKLHVDNIIVVYDDIDMDFGKIRVRDSGSAGGHNGVKDIIKYFGESWKRIKVGVGRDTNYSVSDWVLSKFSEEELIDIENEIYNEVEEQILRIIN